MSEEEAKMEVAVPMQQQEEEAAAAAASPPTAASTSVSTSAESPIDSTPPTKNKSSSKKKRSKKKKKAPPNSSSSKKPSESSSKTDDNNNHDSNSKKSTPRRKSVGTASALNKTYIQLVQEAIMAYKDRTGSSLAAIKKYILQEYPDLGGPHFASRVNMALKNGLASKPPKFTKIKASYKIAAEYKAHERNKKRKALSASAKKKKAAAAAQKQADAAAKKDAEFQERLKRLSPEEAAALKRQAAESAAKREAAEARAKQLADRMKRRRFPMEDTKLHAEDKELGAKLPPDLQPRPYLPYFWHLTFPLQSPSRHGKTSGQILANSKVEGLDSDSRGLVPDLLAVYHFFRGDVHFTLGSDEPENAIVPDFSLKHLIFAVEQVVNGNARKSKQLPPLLVHLFVTCLQILCQPPDDDTAGELSKNKRQLRKDFATYLLPGLTPASWSDLLYLYMDAMDRYYTTDASRDPNVLQPLPIDTDYLFGVTDEPAVAAPMTPGVATPAPTEKDVAPPAHPLPAGYNGYLGDSRSVLFRALHKLSRQDPWLLTAEELMALLRALTEDVLASHPAASEDMARREEEMHELSRAKRAADMKFRKVRLAFEGPKRPSRAKPKAENGDNGKADGEKEKGEENETTNDPEKPEEPFKPTASKRQFEAAKKAQEKASEAYEKGIRSLVARTEPVGYDRNFNAVYCFRHDPEVLYVEDRKPAVSFTASHMPADVQFHRYSWHVVETTSLFDQLVTSLDIRGRREHNLYEELVGPQGANQALRRYLYDDVKEKADARAKIKEMESLRERLKVANIKCDEEKGRRSGRLAGQAEMELIQIQSEIDALEKQASGTKPPEEARDYDELTGYYLLKQFELAGRVETRRTREKKAVAKARKIPLLRCSKLSSTGNIDGTGVVGMIVSSLLEIEEHCESLAPWDRADVARSTWISRLEGAVHAWNSISSDTLGSPPDPSRTSIGAASASASSVPMHTNETPSRQLKRDSIGSIGSNGSSVTSKRRKFESPVSTASGSASGHSVSSIITLLKQPLLDLEERVADITNVALATRDADLADDNMSTQSSEEDEANKERLERAWKKLVHKIRLTATRRHSQIRELLVSAIGAARKAHLPQVVSELRAALLLYHPNAAGECKVAAIKILQSHGDYEEDEDDDESDDEDGEGNEESTEEEAPSVISAEAAILKSSLGGSADASREDWVQDVKSVKSLSRVASLTASFMSDAMEKLEKLEVERDALNKALDAWNKAEERQAKLRDSKKKAGGVPKEIVGPSEVWANVQFTDEIVMAKAEAYPYWPAKKCEAKDQEIASSLSKLGRSLVAFVGEMGGLRVVKTSDLKPFTGEVVDEGEEVVYSKDIRTQLDDCMTMARRILRGRERTK